MDPRRGGGALDQAPKQPKILKIDIFLGIIRKQTNFIQTNAIYIDETKSDEFSEIGKLF